MVGRRRGATFRVSLCGVKPRVRLVRLETRARLECIYHHQGEDIYISEEKRGVTAA